MTVNDSAPEEPVIPPEQIVFEKLIEGSQSAAASASKARGERRGDAYAGIQATLAVADRLQQVVVAVRELVELARLREAREAAKAEAENEDEAEAAPPLS